MALSSASKRSSPCRSSRRAHGLRGLTPLGVSVIAVPEPISATENGLGHAPLYGTVYVRTAGCAGGTVLAAFLSTLSWNCPLPRA